jgi:hypothetical protein
VRVGAAQVCCPVICLVWLYPLQRQYVCGRCLYNMANYFIAAHMTSSHSRLCKPRRSGWTGMVNGAVQHGKRPKDMLRPPHHRCCVRPCVCA